MTLIESEFLRFVDITPSGRKTKVTDIYSVHHGNALGQISWYGAWRQYCFKPNSGTIWNTACLETVNANIKMLMDERKNK